VNLSPLRPRVCVCVFRVGCGVRARDPVGPWPVGLATRGGGGGGGQPPVCGGCAAAASISRCAHFEMRISRHAPAHRRDARISAMSRGMSGDARISRHMPRAYFTDQRL